MEIRGEVKKIVSWKDPLFSERLARRVAFPIIRDMFNIAANTFRELVRNRILTMILFFAITMILFSTVLASLSLGQSERIILDFGLAMMEICGLICVVFIGGQILFREIEGRTIYLILSKPIARRDFLLGKFFGFSAIIAVLLVLQSIVFSGLLYFEGIGFSLLLPVAIIAIFAKLLIVFAIILFFSTFTTPLLSIFLTIGIYISAHSANSVLDMALRLKSQAFVALSQGLVALLPNFEALNFAKNTIGSSIALSPSLFGLNF